MKHALPAVVLITLPLPVPYLAYELEDRMVGYLLQLADQLREQGRPFADHVLKVGRHLSRHGQQHVAVDVELVRELTRRFLRGGATSPRSTLLR